MPPIKIVISPPLLPPMACPLYLLGSVLVAPPAASMMTRRSTSPQAPHFSRTGLGWKANLSSYFTPAVYGYSTSCPSREMTNKEGVQVLVACSGHGYCETLLFAWPRSSDPRLAHQDVRSAPAHCAAIRCARPPNPLGGTGTTTQYYGNHRALTNHTSRIQPFGCVCYDGYVGADCSERLCPSARAWIDFATDPTTAHAVLCCCRDQQNSPESQSLQHTRPELEGAR